MIVYKINPFYFKDFILISLDKQWINVFGKIPIFKVYIKNQRLEIISEKIVAFDV